MADSQVLKPRLPVEYQEVEYIESNGTEYIDTGIIPKIGDIYQVTYMEFSGVTNYVVFGERTSGTYATSTNQVYYNLSASGTPKITYMFSGTHREVVAEREINAKLSYNVTVTSDYDNAATEPMYIFALNNQGAAAVYAAIRLYEFKINRNSTVIQHLIPCYRKSDNVIGLYDIVSGNFLINNGTGDLSKGADKSTGTWEHSLRKLTTATEIITPPTTIYADGTAATVNLKGNTVQNGTPSPSNPVDVVGVGDRTENLFDINYTATTFNCSVSVNDNTLTQTNSGIYARSIWKVDNLVIGEEYTVSILANNPNSCSFRLNVMDSTDSTVIAAGNAYTDSRSYYISFTATETTHIVRIYSNTTVTISTSTITFTNIMLNLGSTALPYEPYGYKIPISNGSTTTPIYLGSTASIRQIQKLVLTGQENDWIYQSDYTRFLLTVSDVKLFVVRTAPMYSTHYQVIDDGRPIADVPNNSVYFNNQYLCITTSDYTSTTDFKAFLAAQYSAGTPVEVYYILETATTAAVNEPLMKIGDYADTLSNATAIPTTDGANSITVDTTVQPSEFTATWTGWHDSSVKEWDGSDWS